MADASKSGVSATWTSVEWQKNNGKWLIVAGFACCRGHKLPALRPKQRNFSRKQARGIMPVSTPLLDTIQYPADIRRLEPTSCASSPTSCARRRSAASVTGGHLGAGLGVVELTVALHYVFDTPRDRLIWDVGHQAYPHKIVTGRRNRIRTLRQEGGLSGFTSARESEYDPFGAAHSSTSISAGLGMAVARDLAGGNNHVDRRDRRRRDERRHGLRGDEQCRRAAQPADRRPERQRHVDRPAGRRDVGTSLAPAVGPALPVAAQSRPHGRRSAARAARDGGAAGRGIRARLRGRRHAVRRAGLLLCRPGRRPQSRPSAAGAEERARQPSSTSRSWSMSSPRRARAIRRPRRAPTSTTAW